MEDATQELEFNEAPRFPIVHPYTRRECIKDYLYKRLGRNFSKEKYLQFLVYCLDKIKFGGSLEEKFRLYYLNKVLVFLAQKIIPMHL